MTVRYDREDSGAGGEAQWFGGEVRRTQHAVQSFLQNSKYMPTMLMLFLKRPSTLLELVSENSPNFVFFEEFFTPALAQLENGRKKL